MNENTKHCECQSSLEKSVETQLLELYGSPIVSGDNLRAALGFNSVDGLRQAITRKTLPIPLFSMQNRKGKYALVKDIACYLVRLRNAERRNQLDGGGEENKKH